MIKLVRIDDRLLHGQVAFSWSNVLTINKIIIANDAAAEDEITKMMLGIAKPRGTDLHVFNIENSIEAIKGHLTDRINVMVIVNCVADAYAIADKIPEITSLNFGGLKEKRGIPSKRFTGSVTLTLDEVELCREMLKRGVELEIRQVPEEKKNQITANNLG